MTCSKTRDGAARPQSSPGRDARGARGKPAYTVGVVSDTHGKLCPEVRRLLTGVDHILHAGDIGSAAVLSELGAVAGVTAVRGNCDYEAWALSLPVTAEIELAGVRFVLTHMVRSEGDFSRKPSTELVPQVVVSGHTHLAALEWRDEVLYLNPGSAGPRRFGRPRTIALVWVFDSLGGPTNRVRAEILAVPD